MELMQLNSFKFLKQFIFKKQNINDLFYEKNPDNFSTFG